MKDIVGEYVWFGITILGTILSLSLLSSLFFGETSTVSKMISVVLGELM